MLTLSKHRVGRVQIALRRGAHVENLANFDEVVFLLCEKVRANSDGEKTPKIASEITSGVPPGRPREAR